MSVGPSVVVAPARCSTSSASAQFGERRPNQLSGGQRQRVALARALVNQPGVLLLDEPLGALDLKLREEMQVELKSIQHAVGITFVFVTHDQGEALSMSTRIAVFNEGRVEQVGTPQEIYDRPATSFVAGFVGTSNLLDAEQSARLLGVAQPHTLRPERIRLANGGDVGGSERVGHRHRRRRPVPRADQSSADRPRRRWAPRRQRAERRARRRGRRQHRPDRLAGRCCAESRATRRPPTTIRSSKST